MRNVIEIVAVQLQTQQQSHIDVLVSSGAAVACMSV